MAFLELVAKKRDGGVLTRGELEEVVRVATDGEVPDYQLAAWLMAAFTKGLNEEETVDLTKAMADSGERVDLSGLPKPWVDKHSTGGVGDKTTVVLLPVLAACGLTVVKMSGAGLGITGGTVDKLSSVPGFRMDLSPEEMEEQAKRVGIAITGQTPRLAPADKVLYGLRDVTATVPSVPLIVSSILSKKMAGGAETVVLDVKCGRGAFMEDLERAKELSEALEKIGGMAGLKVRTRVTDMDQPLGETAGNALEIKEAIRVLKGEDMFSRVRELVIELAAAVLETVGDRRPREAAAQALDSGVALAKAEEWFAAQGGDVSVFQTEDWGVAPVIREVYWTGAPGFVERVDARRVGESVLELGGGRKTKTDVIDVRVGLETLVEVGDMVAPGQAVYRVHSADDDNEEVLKGLIEGITVMDETVMPRDVILG